MAYDNTNSGALFKNDKKGVENRPDYTGKLDVEGTEYWVSAWVKDGKSGKFMSLSIKPKEQNSRDVGTDRRIDTDKRVADVDSDLPF
jgi:hypothetical protein